MKAITRIFLTLFLLMPVTGFLAAQSLPSEMEYAQEKKEGGRVEAGADVEGGGLHLAQQADMATDLKLAASGERQVGRFHLKGHFQFKQSYENGVKYASTFHPLRPMPYIIADSTGGNWKKQDYLMGADISMPIVEKKLALGLALGLEAGRGAKNIDPRPQAGMCEISVMPSLSYNTGCAGVFSGGFIYEMYRETSNLILYDSSRPQKLYLMKGLGQYTYEIFSSSSRERKYEGNKLGGQISWMMPVDALTLRVDGKYRNGMERAYDIDNSKPHDRGRFITHSYSAAALAVYDVSSWGLSARLSWDGLLGSGREIVQHYDASPAVNAWVTDSENNARYQMKSSLLELDVKAWLKDAENRKGWEFGADLRKDDNIQQYKATSSYWRQDVLYFQPSVGKNVYFPSGTLSLDFRGRMSHLLGSELRYAEREPDDRTISDGLVYHDFYLPYNRYGFAMSLAYKWHLKSEKSISLKGHGAYLSGGGMCRWQAGLGIAYSF